MSQQWFDPSSKWVIEHHGSTILYLAGARNVLSCKARKAEVVQPRKLPDGLIEAQFADASKSELILVEVATYPEERVVEQICGDLRLVRQARRVLVDAVVLCLCPKGQYRVPVSAESTSPRGWSGETLRWKVVELWTLDAEDLLTAPDVALTLWAPLAKFDGPPEILLQRCRDRIERDGGEEKPNLLAVAQVFAQIHFDKPEWLDILGGTKAMIESPLIQQIGAEFRRSGVMGATLYVLQQRLGPPGSNIEAGLAQVKDEQAQLRLTLQAGLCPSLQAFEDALRAELPQRPPPSTRGRKKPRKDSA